MTCHVESGDVLHVHCSLIMRMSWGVCHGSRGGREGPESITEIEIRLCVLSRRIRRCVTCTYTDYVTCHVESQS